jgi:hypothetical protein
MRLWMYWIAFKILRLVNSRVFNILTVMAQLLNWIIYRGILAEDKSNYIHMASKNKVLTPENPIIQSYNWIGLMKAIIKIIIYIQVLFGGSLIMIPLIETTFEYFGVEEFPKFTFNF